MLKLDDMPNLIDKEDFDGVRFGMIRSPWKKDSANG